MILSLDEYASHLQGDALKVFENYKILVLKEEGDISHVCQAYDKDVSFSNKRYHCCFLNGIMLELNMMDQYTLIIVANKVCALYMLLFFNYKLIHQTLIAKLHRH